MYYPKKSSQEFEIPGGTTGRIYESHPNGEQTIAHVSLNGRYPEKGFSINSTCTESLFITEGTLTLTYGDETVDLTTGDVFMILPGTKYSLEGTGTALDLITPAWDKAQNSIIETED